MGDWAYTEGIAGLSSLVLNARFRAPFITFVFGFNLGLFVLLPLRLYY